MKGLVAATAVVGVLAIGGLPALALTLAGEETRTGSTATAEDGGPPGPPAWAQGNGRGADKDEDRDDDPNEGTDEAKPEKDSEKAAEKAQEKGQKQAAKADRWKAKRDRADRGARQGVPPGWGRHHQGRSPHGWAVREWAHCLADAAADLEEGEKLDVRSACGEKPRSPGRAAR